MEKGIFSLAFFVGVLWEQYLQEIQMCGTYGDEITSKIGHSPGYSMLN